jgi:hypothetical protein
MPPSARRRASVHVLGVSQVSRRFEDRREPYVGFRDVGIRLDPVGESAFGGKGKYVTWQ